MIYNQIIQEFIKELEEIKSDLREKIKLKNPKIKLNDSFIKIIIVKDTYYVMLELL